jgi:hypothetical protein
VRLALFAHLCSSSLTNGEVPIIHVIDGGSWTGVRLALLLILHSCLCCFLVFVSWCLRSQFCLSFSGNFCG